MHVRVRVRACIVRLEWRTPLLPKNEPTPDGMRHKRDTITMPNAAPTPPQALSFGATSDALARVVGPLLLSSIFEADENHYIACTMPRAARVFLARAGVDGMMSAISLCSLQPLCSISCPNEPQTLPRRVALWLLGLWRFR